MDNIDRVANEYAEIKTELDVTRKELSRLSGIEEKFNHAVRDLEETKLAYRKLQQELAECKSKYDVISSKYEELQVQHSYLDGKVDAYENFLNPNRLSH